MHRATGDDPTGVRAARFVAPDAPRRAHRRHRRGAPDLESFLIGFIACLIPALLTFLFLVWKGLVQW